jgi:hypothetical protein
MTEPSEVIPKGEDYVPQIPTKLRTLATEHARQRYVRAWDEWRYRSSFSNAMTRDNTRKSFYAAIGLAALGDAVPEPDKTIND